MKPLKGLGARQKYFESTNGSISETMNLRWNRSSNKNKEIKYTPIAPPSVSSKR
jgi:hypothetical protein